MVCFSFLVDSKLSCRFKKFSWISVILCGFEVISLVLEFGKVMMETIMRLMVGDYFIYLFLGM